MIANIAVQYVCLKEHVSKAYVPYLSQQCQCSIHCLGSVCRRFRPRRPVSQTKPAPAFLHASNSQLEVPISISDSHNSRPTSSNLSRFTTSARERQYHRRSSSSSLLSSVLSVSAPFQVFFLLGPVACCTLVLTSPPRSRHVAAEQLSGAAGVRNCDDDDNDDDNNSACDCTLLYFHLIFFIFISATSTTLTASAFAALPPPVVPLAFVRPNLTANSPPITSSAHLPECAFNNGRQQHTPVGQLRRNRPHLFASSLTSVLSHASADGAQPPLKKQLF